MRRTWSSFTRGYALAHSNVKLLPERCLPLLRPRTRFASNAPNYAPAAGSPFKLPALAHFTYFHNCPVLCTCLTLLTTPVNLLRRTTRSVPHMIEKVPALLTGTFHAVHISQKNTTSTTPTTTTTTTTWSATAPPRLPGTCARSHLRAPGQHGRGLVSRFRV